MDSRSEKKDLTGHDDGLVENRELVDSASFDALRSEIIHAQGIRTDLMKYKLVIAAALGALAIGASVGDVQGHIPHVAALIPFVFLYVDAICSHNDIRILVIGRFFQLSLTAYSDYERFCSSLRGVFSTERFALRFFSGVVDLGLAAMGLVLLLAHSSDLSLGIVYMVSGIFGYAGSLWISFKHRGAVREISTAQLPKRGRFDGCGHMA